MGNEAGELIWGVHLICYLTHLSTASLTITLFVFASAETEQLTKWLWGLGDSDGYTHSFRTFDSEIEIWNGARGLCSGSNPPGEGERECGDREAALG